MLRQINDTSKPVEKVTPPRCTVNPRVTTISGQPGVGFDVTEPPGYAELVCLIKVAEAHKDADLILKDLVRHLPMIFAEDPWILGRIQERLSVSLSDANKGSV